MICAEIVLNCILKNFLRISRLLYQQKKDGGSWTGGKIVFFPQGHNAGEIYSRSKPYFASQAFGDVMMRVKLQTEKFSENISTLVVDRSIPVRSVDVKKIYQNYISTLYQQKKAGGSRTGRAKIVFFLKVRMHAKFIQGQTHIFSISACPALETSCCLM